MCFSQFTVVVLIGYFREGNLGHAAPPRDKLSPPSPFSHQWCKGNSFPLGGAKLFSNYLCCNQASFQYSAASVFACILGVLLSGFWLFLLPSNHALLHRARCKAAEADLAVAQKQWMKIISNISSMCCAETLQNSVFSCLPHDSCSLVTFKNDPWLMVCVQLHHYACNMSISFSEQYPSGPWILWHANAACTGKLARLNEMPAMWNTTRVSFSCLAGRHI